MRARLIFAMALSVVLCILAKRIFLDSPLGASPIRVDGASKVPLLLGGIDSNVDVGLKVNTWFDRTSRYLGVHYMETNASVDAEFQFTNPEPVLRKLSGFRRSCTCTEATITIGRRRFVVEGAEDSTNALFELLEDGSRLRVAYVSVEGQESGQVVLSMTTVLSTENSLKASLMFVTDDPVMEYVTLDAQASVRSLFVVSPEEVHLGGVFPGETREFEVTVASPVLASFNVVGLGPLPKGIEAMYEKVDDLSETIFRIRGRYEQTTERTAGGGYVIVKTDYNDATIAIPIIAYRKSPVTIEPGEYVSLGVIRKEEGTSKVVTISDVESRGIVVRSVEVEELSFEKVFIEVKTLQNSGEVAEITISILPGVPAGLVRGNIVVQLNHPVVESVRLLFSGFAR